MGGAEGLTAPLLLQPTAVPSSGKCIGESKQMNHETKVCPDCAEEVKAPVAARKVKRSR